jgi:hypothetical protein
MIFLYAAATDSAELPGEPTTQERRKLLGAYTAFHIILNVAHRRHTAPLQRFMSRVVETPGASYNTRKLLTIIFVSLDQAFRPSEAALETLARTNSSKFVQILLRSA